MDVNNSGTSWQSLSQLRCLCLGEHTDPFSPGSPSSPWKTKEAERIVWQFVATVMNIDATRPTDQLLSGRVHPPCLPSLQVFLQLLQIPEIKTHNRFLALCELQLNTVTWVLIEGVKSQLLKPTCSPFGPSRPTAPWEKKNIMNLWWSWNLTKTYICLTVRSTKLSLFLGLFSHNLGLDLIRPCSAWLNFYFIFSEMRLLVLLNWISPFLVPHIELDNILCWYYWDSYF